MMTLSLYNRILLFWLIRSSWILTDFSNGETPTGCICIDESCHYFNCPDNSNVNNDRNNNNDDRMLCRKKDQLLEDLKNVRFPMTLLDATENVMSSMICVEKDNNPIKLDYFSYVEPLGSLFNSYGVKEYSYQMVDSDATNFAEQLDDSVTFEVGDTIPFVDGNGDFVDGGELRLPLPNSAGICQDTAKVEYGINVKDKSCIRYAQDIDSDQCVNGILSTNYYLNDFYVGVRRSAAFASNEQRSSIEDNSLFVAIQVNQIFLHNGTDVLQSLLTSSSWNETTRTCNNAVHTVSYNIILSSVDGSIESVKMDIQLINLESLDVEWLVQQKFSVAFQTIENENDNTNALIGTPGYIFGGSVLFAKSSKEDGSVLLPAKIELMKSEDCDSKPFKTPMDIGFGDDFIIGCALRLNASELEDLCTSTSLNHPYLSSILIGDSSIHYPKWFDIDLENTTHVGIFANAFVSESSDWTKLQVSNSLRNRQWFNSASTCEGLLTGVKYEFIWNYSGHITRPQAKILAARVSYEFQSLKYSSRDTRQPFQFSIGLSWSHVDALDERRSISPRTPSLLFSLPSDAFYPFHVS